MFAGQRANAAGRSSNFNEQPATIARCMPIGHICMKDSSGAIPSGAAIAPYRVALNGCKVRGS